MRELARHLVCILVMLGFAGVSTGVVLAIHLDTHQAESDCCHDSHQHERGDHERQEDEENSSRHCDTCQQLATLTKRILVQSFKLLPELAPTEHILPNRVNHYCYSHSLPPLQPRAPPTCPIS